LGQRPDGILISADGRSALLSFWRAESDGHHGAHDGNILSPMPGRIIAVDVTQGQTVSKGQKLLTLEAMKMEHSLVAPFDGVVAELNAETGAQVKVDALMVRIEKAE
jgi:3-methylcrotonyl-CoA carboxylase alpha subunit